MVPELVRSTTGMLCFGAMDTLDPRVQAALARHPELLQIVREVDRSLIRWSLDRSPFERLRGASKSLRGLRRFRRVASEGG
jgi:hypothetical protein